VAPSKLTLHTDSRDPGKAPFCGNCGLMLPGGSKFCNECGTTVVRAIGFDNAPPFCGQCSAALPVASKFCNECGATVVRPVGSVPPEPHDVSTSAPTDSASALTRQPRRVSLHLLWIVPVVALVGWSIYPSAQQLGSVTPTETVPVSGAYKTSGQASPSPQSDSPADTQRPPDPEVPVVTMEKYNRVQEGMTYDQVRVVIGSDGEQIGRSNISGYKGMTYSWTNQDGSIMTAVFSGSPLQDVRLTIKAQSGLR
jgi:hypothetical protein